MESVNLYSYYTAKIIRTFLLYLLPCIHVMAAVHPMHFYAIIDRITDCNKKGDFRLDAYLSGVAAHAGPALAVFCAAFIQSITGFGLVIIAAPLLMFFYEPKLTVPIMLLIACSSNSVQGFLMRRQANYPLIGTLYLGMLLGQPFGFFFFTYISNDALKVFINVVVLLTLLLMHVSHRRITQCRRNTIITGMLSGFTAITTGMGGLPFLIYLAYTEMPANVFRATCFIYFFLGNATSLVSYLVGGYPLTDAFNQFLYLLPALVTGIIAGHFSMRYIPASFFRKFIFVILYIASIYTIISIVGKSL